MDQTLSREPTAPAATVNTQAPPQAVQHSSPSDVDMPDRTSDISMTPQGRTSPIPRVYIRTSFSEPGEVAFPVVKPPQPPPSVARWLGISAAASSSSDITLARLANEPDTDRDQVMQEFVSGLLTSEQLVSLLSERCDVSSRSHLEIQP